MTDMGNNKFWSIFSSVFHGWAFTFFAFNAPHDCSCENEKEEKKKKKEFTFMLYFLIANTEYSQKVNPNANILLLNPMQSVNSD